jgi:hypothetical protein
MKKFRNRIVKINMARHMVITPVFRVSFPQVFTARAYEDAEDAKKVFQLDMIFDDKEDFKEQYRGKKIQTPSMMKVVSNAKFDQWGKDKAKWPKFNFPVFKDGSERVNSDGEVYAGYEGKWFVTAKSGEKFIPKVIGKSGQPLSEEEFYGGCFARAQLLARPYAFGKNFGVRFILLQVMKEKDGERFGGVGADVFDTVQEDDNWDSDTESDEDEEDL